MFEYPCSSRLFWHHPKAVCRLGGGPFRPHHRTHSLENPEGSLRCFLCPHSDQRHAFSTVTSCKVAGLLAPPCDPILYPLPKTTGACPGLLHCNPTAQCSWQRPLLLVQQKISFVRHSSYPHLWLRPLDPGHNHTEETRLFLAWSAPVDN